MSRGCDNKTGVMQIIPVLFLVLFAIACAAAVALPARVGFAAPPEEKLPELSKPQLHREKTKLEQAVDRAAAMLLQGKLPASLDGVRFALWLYGDKGDVAYRDVATRMARDLAKDAMSQNGVTSSPTGKIALYWVAQAGGPTLAEARRLRIMNEPRMSMPGLPLSADLNLAKITAGDLSSLDLEYFRDPIPETQPESGHRQDHFPTTGALSFEWMWLRDHAQVAQFSGFSSIPKAMGIVAHNILDRFLDPQTQRFEESGDAGTPDPHQENAITALAVWETGLLIGDGTLREAGRKALESDLEAALQEPEAVAIVGLAAGRMSRHHLQLAIIGDPKDSMITSLRQAAYFMFEPNKIILNLDPKADSTRMAELMYPAEAAPAMFVCVETLCSPPIKDPAELEKQVAEIKKLAAQVEQ